MKTNKTIIAIAVLLFGLLAGGLGAAVLLSQPSSVDAAPAVRQGTCPDDEATNGADDADEANVSPGQTGITADEARAAAEAAYPGSKAREVELENENGAIVYEVELDNGLEVVLDPANGNTLCSEQDDAD